MFDYSDISKKRAADQLARMLEKEPQKLRKPPKQIAVIDQNGCTGCEACVQFCPVDCIELVPGPVHPDMAKTVEVDLDRCIGCKKCVEACPWDTIHMIEADKSPEVANEWTLRSVIKPDAPIGNLWAGLWVKPEEPKAAEAAAAEAPKPDETPQS